MIEKDVLIDNIIKNSYEQIKVPNDLFESVYDRLNEKRKYKILKNIAACLSVTIITVFFVVIGQKIYFNVNKSVPTEQNSEIVSELPVASEVVYTEGESHTVLYNHLESPVGKTLIEDISENVVVVKEEEILEYTNYMKGNGDYISTPFIKSRVTVEKVFKGNLSGEVNMMSCGGVISVADYLKGLLPGMTAQSKYENMTEEEKENTYIRPTDNIIDATIEPEVGKYYLVYMNYNEAFEEYQVLDDLIYEYDIENDRTKNTTTDEWEDYEFGKK